MTALYAIALVVGVVLATPFLFGGRRHFDRRVVAGLLGFGLAGMSSTFAGWNLGLALIAALVGGGGAAAAVRWLSPVGDQAE